MAQTPPKGETKMAQTPPKGETNPNVNQNNIKTTTMMAQTPPKGEINPNVNQNNIKTTICVAGWTATVRPPSSVMAKDKKQAVAKLGIKDITSGEWDHFISLELGGHINSPDNLWFQPYLPKPGAREKDVVESYLHRQVCSGAITLLNAQKTITKDWVSIYNKIKK